LDHNSWTAGLLKRNNYIRHSGELCRTTCGQVNHDQRTLEAGPPPDNPSNFSQAAGTEFCDQLDRRIRVNGLGRSAQWQANGIFRSTALVLGWFVTNHRTSSCPFIPGISTLERSTSKACGRQIAIASWHAAYSYCHRNTVGPRHFKGLLGIKGCQIAANISPKYPSPAKETPFSPQVTIMPPTDALAPSLRPGIGPICQRVADPRKGPCAITQKRANSRASSPSNFRRIGRSALEMEFTTGPMARP